MKKISLILVIALLITGALSSSAFAADTAPIHTYDITKFQVEEETNKEVLLERAKNNITDYKTPNMKVQYNAKEFDLKNYSTTQLLKVEIDSQTKDQKETYVTSNFALLIPKEENRQDKSLGLNLGSLVGSLSSDFNYYKNLGVKSPIFGGTTNDDAYDRSIGVYAESTIYWTKYQNYKGTDLDFYLLTKAKGSWSVEDSQLSISDREAILVCSGPGFGAGGYVLQRKVKSPSGNSFSYTAPSSWKPVSDEAEFLCGVTMNCDVERNHSGSTWLFSFVNWK